MNVVPSLEVEVTVAITAMVTGEGVRGPKQIAST